MVDFTKIVTDKFKMDGSVTQTIKNTATEFTNSATNIIKSPNAVNPFDAQRLSKNTGNNIAGEPSEIYTKGVNEEQAEQIFQREIEKEQEKARAMLKSIGVTKVPKRMFDTIVSFQRDTGDATYAYIADDKIDLMGLYAAGEWERASKFMSQDERNRQRRIEELKVAKDGDYGKIDSNKDIISRGLEKTSGLIEKGKLNQMTGDPATWQQKLAAGSAYQRITGSSMPGLNFTEKSNILNNLDTNKITDALKSVTKKLPF
jgi:hypothetical protein